MCVEGAFGILKCKWKIIMKCMDCSLCFYPRCCFYMHNFCITYELYQGAFDRSWIKEVEKKLQNKLVWIELKEGFELHGERVAFIEVRGKIESHPNMAILGVEKCEVHMFKHSWFKKMKQKKIYYKKPQINISFWPNHFGTTNWKTNLLWFLKILKIWLNLKAWMSKKLQFVYQCCHMSIHVFQ